MKTKPVSLLQNNNFHTKPGCYAKRQDNDPAQVTQLRKHARRVTTPKTITRNLTKRVCPAAIQKTS